MPRCAAHPEVETNLRCGSCGKSICPKCLVETPVGAKCRDCAGIKRLPTFKVSGRYYLRAAVTAFGLAIALGLLLGFITSYLSFNFFRLLLALGVGWVIGELVSRAANRKRSGWLAAIGSGAVILCYVIVYLIDFYRYGYFDWAIYRTIFNVLAVGIAVYYSTRYLR